MLLRDSGLINGDQPLVDLSGADLTDTNLSGLDLSTVNPSGADLRGTNLSGADLSDANLSGADLRDVRRVDKNKLEGEARSLQGATMPDGSKHD